MGTLQLWLPHFVAGKCSGVPVGWRLFDKMLSKMFLLLLKLPPPIVKKVTFCILFLLILF